VRSLPRFSRTSRSLPVAVRCDPRREGPSVAQLRAVPWDWSPRNTGRRGAKVIRDDGTGRGVRGDCPTTTPSGETGSRVVTRDRER
jgi:hypothetical protein